MKQELTDEPMTLNQAIKQEVPEELEVSYSPTPAQVPKLNPVSTLPKVPSLPVIPDLPKDIPEAQSSPETKEADRTIEILDDSIEEISEPEKPRKVKLSFESDEEDGGHTCEINAKNICEQCFHYRFSGSKAFIMPQKTRIGNVQLFTN